MSQPTYKTLAALYQLLGTATADDLRETSRLPEVSRNVRKALLALAAEASGKQNAGSDGLITASTRSDRPKNSRPVAQRAATPAKRAAIISLLQNRKNFPDKAALSRFAAEIGAGLQISPKWGLPRAISALATAIEKSPQVLAKVDLSDQKLDPNTKGWIDIILGRK